jgi:hypothetical protein
MVLTGYGVFYGNGRISKFLIVSHRSESVYFHGARCGEIASWAYWSLKPDRGKILGGGYVVPMALR